MILNTPQRAAIHRRRPSILQQKTAVSFMFSTIKDRLSKKSNKATEESNKAATMKAAEESVKAVEEPFEIVGLDDNWDRFHKTPISAENLSDEFLS
jgi:DNA polymerase II small subunit/DNA polymerase delta subunit B